MNVNDSIVVEGLDVSCRVGHTRAERRFPQIVSLNIEVFASLETAARKDDMRHTIDYAGLIKKIERVLASKRFVLIESLAETVAALALQHPLAEAVAVKATKKVFANVQAVGARVWRAKA